MEAAHQRAEVEALLCDDHQLAVQHHAPVRQFGQRSHHLREVARQWSVVAAPQVDALLLTEPKAAEAVPLGLIDEVPVRQLTLEPCQHRPRRRFDWQRPYFKTRLVVALSLRSLLPG